MIISLIGTSELVLITGIVLLLFGGKKLPEMMRGLGRGVKEFRAGTKEIKEELNSITKLPENIDNDSSNNTEY